MKQTFTKVELGWTFSSDAYSLDGGKTWRWVANHALCPLDACRDYKIPCDVEAQQAARDAELGEFVQQYRALQPQTPSREERAEMRAAFGPGKEVVNILTGRRFRT